MRNPNNLLLYLLVATSLLFARLLPQLSVIITSTVAIYVVARTRTDLIPLLILANLPVTSFFVSGGYAAYGTTEFSMEVYETSYINIAGLPVSSGLVTVVTMTAFCFHKYLTARKACFPGSLNLVFAIWIAGAIVAVAISLKGLLLGQPAWGGPTRAYLSTIGVFYGYCLPLHSRQHARTVFLNFLAFFFAVGALTATGFFHHRLVFLGASLAPGMSTIALRDRAITVKLLAVSNLVVWTLFAAYGFSYSNTSSFTLVSLFALSCTLGLIAGSFSAGTASLAGKALGYPTCILVFAYMVLSITGFPRYFAIDTPTSQSERSTIDNLRYKAVDDRGTLWAFAWEDIMRDSKILPIPGERLRVVHPKRGVEFVTHGTHNSFLQALRENGFVSGTAIIIIMCFSLVGSSRAFANQTSDLTKSVAIGAICQLTVGAVTGHYVIGQTIGAFIFMLAGMAIAGNARDCVTGKRSSHLGRSQQNSLPYITSIKMRLQDCKSIS